MLFKIVNLLKIFTIKPTVYNVCLVILLTIKPVKRILQTKKMEKLITVQVILR